MKNANHPFVLSMAHVFQTSA